jgi:hypothetical protein
MVLYLCVLIMFSIHWESLKLILATDPFPMRFCHTYTVYLYYTRVQTQCPMHLAQSLHQPTELSCLIWGRTPGPQVAHPADVIGLARAIAVSLFIGLGFHRRHHFPTYHLTAAARALLSIGFICWMTAVGSSLVGAIVMAHVRGVWFHSGGLEYGVYDSTEVARNGVVLFHGGGSSRWISIPR